MSEDDQSLKFSAPIVKAAKELTERFPFKPYSDEIEGATPMTAPTPDPITDEELVAWQAMCSAATPGPINAVIPVNKDLQAVRLFSGSTYFASVCNSDMDDTEIMANAELFAASRTAMPRLIAEVERLRAQHYSQPVANWR